MILLFFFFNYFLIFILDILTFTAVFYLSLSMMIAVGYTFLCLPAPVS